MFTPERAFSFADEYDFSRPKWFCRISVAPLRKDHEVKLKPPVEPEPGPHGPVSPFRSRPSRRDRSRSPSGGARARAEEPIHEPIRPTAP